LRGQFGSLVLVAHQLLELEYVVHVLKGLLATHHFVEQHAVRIDVCFFAVARLVVFALAGEHLGGLPLGGTGHERHALVDVNVATQTQIRYFGDIFGADLGPQLVLWGGGCAMGWKLRATYEHVLALEIAVDNVERMQEDHALRNLERVLEHLVVGEGTALHHGLERALVHQLRHDHEHTFLIAPLFDARTFESDDVGVRDHAHNGDLAIKVFESECKRGLAEHFDGYVVVIVLARVHLRTNY
jgi:hypothetical protein